MKRGVCILGIAAASCALAACQKTVTTYLPAGPQAYDAIAVPADEVIPDAYVLRAGDRVDVSVFREADFSGQNLLIDSSGNIFLPALGQMPAAGLTQADLSQAIADALGRRYLRNPQVTVSVQELASRTITVEGEVKQPGIYPVEPGHTLLSAMALARSPTERAKLDEVLIFRTIDGHPAGARFDLAEIRAGRVPDPMVLPGDVVVVGFSQLRGAYQDMLKAAPLFNVFTQF